MGDFNTLSSMTARELPEKFLVAFSFAGEQREMEVLHACGGG